jgi:hypothetical protein
MPTALNAAHAACSASPGIVTAASSATSLVCVEGTREAGDSYGSSVPSSLCGRSCVVVGVSAYAQPQ